MKEGRCSKNYKIAIITRTYLLFQKKPVTGKKITDFINNEYHVKEAVTKAEVVTVLRLYKHSLRIEVLKGRPNKYYIKGVAQV